jgi:hypothetical protein
VGTFSDMSDIVLKKSLDVGELFLNCYSNFEKITNLYSSFHVSSSSSSYSLSSSFSSSSSSSLGATTSFFERFDLSNM